MARLISFITHIRHASCVDPISKQTDPRILKAILEAAESRLYTIPKDLNLS